MTAIDEIVELFNKTNTIHDGGSIAHGLKFAMEVAEVLRLHGLLGPEYDEPNPRIGQPVDYKAVARVAQQEAEIYG